MGVEDGGGDGAALPDLRPMHRRATRQFAGHTLADIEAPFERDVLGSNPVATATESAHAAVAAFEPPGALSA
jgi:hypothetical protein